MTIACAIRHRLGSFNLDADFAVDGKLTALFGPSGCGKTSIINAIAGLLRPDAATISINGETLVDTGRSIFVPAHLRRIGYVFQDARLLPHLSVAQNLAYGRWFTPKADRYADERAIHAMLGIDTLLARKPRELSGGEKQRVALGRALLQSPRLLLMDEPLASLDEARKQEVLPYLERLRDEVKVPIIYVSHSPAEVARLASHVVLLKDGKLVEAGAARDILPAIASVSEEFALDAGTPLDMTVKSIDQKFNLTTLTSAAGIVRLPGAHGRTGDKIRLFIRSTEVMLATSKPRGLSALNVLQGTVVSIDNSSASSALVRLRCGEALIAATITRKSAADLKLRPGSRAYAIFKSLSFKMAAAGSAGQPATVPEKDQLSR